MSISFKLKSHVFNNQRGDQLLCDHLEGVTRIALETMKYHGITDENIVNVCKTICMCHDFGKASTYFQDYLDGKYSGDLKQHGEISAYFAYYMLPKKWKVIGFICVKRHHGNIDIESSFFAPNNEENLMKICKSIKSNKDEVEKIYGTNIDDFFKSMENGELIKEVRRSYTRRNIQMKKETVVDCEKDFIWFQYFWALLLTADKTQLITGKTFNCKNILCEKIAREYKNEIRDQLITKLPGIEKQYLFEVRDQIYNTVIESVNNINLNKDRIMSINVPTGTGKTISVYGAAFRLSERIREEFGFVPNIIYSIPFMSVIDQNYEVLENILRNTSINTSSDLLLKHHSMSPIRYVDSEEKEYSNYDARFLMENWQSTIVTTTFVQLFNALFKSGLNGIMHKFHRLSGSIIILDEVQAIPPEYYLLIEDFFRILTENFNCFIITVTATRPLFLEGIELVKNNKDIFENMNRIVIENHTDKDVDLGAFEEIVEEDIENNNEKSFLIIMNTVKSALNVYDYLKESRIKKRKILYLSTEIIPVRRLEIINEIKDSSEKYILVSTQLIEAGVDLDFDIIYRDFAPLDCINQSAGRANRNAIKGKGVVKVYRIKNESNKYLSSYIYSKALLEASYNILKGRDVINESELWSINNEYFMKLKEVTKNKCYEQYKKYCDDIKRINVQEIRKLELIEENNNKIDVIVRYNDEVEKNIKVLENLKEYEEQDILNVWRALNYYRISVNKKEVSDICYEICGANFIDLSDYDINRGIKVSKTISL